MPRNKHPEETVKQILEISLNLFMEKGYDNTTIQDIVDRLGMSKGAIYHHFKSKDDILGALLIRDNDVTNSDKDLEEIMLHGKDGRDVLRRVFIYSLTNPQKLKIDANTLMMYKSPQILVWQLKNTLHGVAKYFERILIKANGDGSLNVANPKNSAEIVALLMNIWLNPGVFEGSREEIIKRLDFYRSMLIGFGIDVIDAEVYNAFIFYYDSVFSNTNRQLDQSGGESNAKG